MKKLIVDAGLDPKGITDKPDLVKEAIKAIEILKVNPPKAKPEAPPRPTVTELKSVEEFDKFTKGGLMTVVAFLDKSQKCKDF